MTKDYFLELAEYNVWANKTVCSWFEKINDEQWKQPVVSSFNSIEATAVHIAGAEKIWFERLSKQPLAPFLTNTFAGSKSELVGIWENACINLKLFIEHISEDTLAEGLYFKSIKGIEFTLPYYQLFAHVFNHSTYHRGQLITMLRQVGFTEVSSLDITTYFKEKKD